MARLSGAVAKKMKVGSAGMGRGSAVAIPDRRIPTGSLALDVALGGGIRVGWITGFFGDKSGGKTSTSKRIAGIAQGLCRNCFRQAKNVVAVPPSDTELAEDPDSRWGATGECTCFAEGLYKPEEPAKNSGEGVKEYRERIEAWREQMMTNSYEELVVAWINLEFSFDEIWAKRLGIDTNRLFLVNPTSGEEGIDIMSALVLSGEIDFLIVDSIAQLVPKAELSESMEKWQQGLQARIVNKGVRKLVSGASFLHNQRRQVTQIWINQTREKIGMLFGDPTVKPGGKGQDFGLHAEVRFRKSKAEIEHEIYGNKDETIDLAKWETFDFTITKQRTSFTKGFGGSYKVCMRTNDVWKIGDVMEDEFVRKLAMKYLVEQKDKKYVLGDREFATQNALFSAITNDREFYLALKDVLLDYLLKRAVGDIA